jgi:hypothetical protein
MLRAREVPRAVTRQVVLVWAATTRWGATGLPAALVFLQREVTGLRVALVFLQREVTGLRVARPRPVASRSGRRLLIARAVRRIPPMAITTRVRTVSNVTLAVPPQALQFGCSQALYIKPMRQRRHPMFRLVSPTAQTYTPPIRPPTVISGSRVLALSTGPQRKFGLEMPMVNLRWQGPRQLQRATCATTPRSTHVLRHRRGGF